LCFGSGLVGEIALTGDVLNDELKLLYPVLKPVKAHVNAFR
jgi:hypothetical protein